jgi:hypothetical protein
MSDNPIRDAAIKAGSTIIAVITVYWFLGFLYANNSAPGDAFYPLRQVIETARAIRPFLVPGAGLGLVVLLYIWNRDDGF